MRIGIDLGGTKIEIIALADNGDVLRCRRQDTPTDDYQATLATIVEMVAQLEAELGQRGTIGIATPGAISPASGLMKNANSVCLNGQALDRDLAAMLGRDIRLANDADCFALSEAVDGSGAGASTVFGVIIGTGTGGGLVVNGRLLQGPNAIAGEWGHNPLPWPTATELPGPACYCGLHGCIETHLSGPGLARYHQQQHEQSLNAIGIVSAAARGDMAAQQSLEHYEHCMARALASVINVIDPDVIVLGGGLSNIKRLYENVPAQWSQYVFSDRVDTRLLPAQHGDSSGVRGAAWLWDRE